MLPAQSLFFHERILERETVIIRDLVNGLAQAHLRAENIEQPTTAAAQHNFDRAFSTLKDLTGAVRIKIYDPANRIIWSDDPFLIGKVVGGEQRLHQAIAGRAAAVFNPQERTSHAEERLPDIPLVEFYVPFSVKKPGTAGAEIDGTFALYRNAEPLLTTIRHGMWLLWAVSGAGGLILYGALYGLFRSVYRRQREAELRLSRLNSEHAHIVQMEKLSAVGTMIGEVAHQFNNPLVGVMNLAQLAEREPGNPPRTRELLTEIRRAGEHCRGFVQRMLDFTRIARCERQRTDLGTLVADTLSLFGQTSASAAKVNFEPPGEPATLDVDPVLIRHALFNLLTNAAQANPGGPIEINLRRDTGTSEPGWILAVCDHGPGMTREVMERLFTPFFTTRAGGTGLGLAVVQHIATLHGGSVTAANQPSGGACFTIWLPETIREDGNESQDTAG